MVGRAARSRAVVTPGQTRDLIFLLGPGLMQSARAVASRGRYATAEDELAPSAIFRAGGLRRLGRA